MKKLLIILAFLPFILNGQMQTLGKVWTGQLNVVGSDTLLYDSISDSNTDWELIEYTGDISLEYIMISENGKVIIEGDTITIQQLGGLGLRNYNNADTLFIQKVADPARITRIGYSSTAAADVNNYWQAMEITATMLDVCETCTYTSFEAANNASSANDTIIIYSGVYDEAESGTYALTVLNDGVNFISLADVKFNSLSTYCAYSDNADNVVFDGIYFENSDNTDIFRTNITTDNFQVRNCHLSETTTRNFLNIANNSDYTLTVSETNINKRVDYRTTVIFNDCYIEGEQTLFITSIGAATNYACNYSKLTNTGTGIIYILNDQDNYLNNCRLNGEIYYNNSTLFGGTKYLEACTITRDLLSPVIQLDNGDTGAKININNCTFYDEYKLGNIINLADYGLTIDSSTFYDLRAISVSNTVVKEATIENSYFESDSIIAINLEQAIGFVNKDSLISSVASSITIKSTIAGADSGTANYNYLTTPICDTAGGIVIGNDISENLFNTNYYDIIGNKIIGGGDCGIIGGLHSISVFNQKGANVLFNYVEKNKHGCVIKSEDTTQSGTVVAGNIFVDCVNFFTLRGVDSVNAYNNTCINYTIQPDGLLLYTHEDYQSNPMESNDVRNNIFANFSTHGRMLESDLDANITNTIIDNNVWYNVADTFALSNDIAYDYETYKSTFSKDSNSINADPLLSATLCPDSNSPANGSGVDVGQDSLIVCGATYPNPEKIAVFAPFDMGAIEIPDPPKTINSAVRVVGGGQWIYNRTKVGY